MNRNEKPILTNYAVYTSTRGKHKEWFRIRVNGVKSRYYINRNGQIKTSTDTIIEPYLLNGYYAYSLNIQNSDGTFKNFLTTRHRLLACVFIPVDRKYLNQGYRQENLTVNHKDGNKLNDSLDNLEWATPSENTLHAINTGLSNVSLGENSHLATIDEATAIKICEMIEAGWSNKEITDKLRVSKDIVKHIRYGETWKQLSTKYNFPKDNQSNSYSDEQIHEICRLLSTGKFNTTQIEEMTGINSKYIGTIRDGKYRTNISSQYTFPKSEAYRQHKFSPDEIHAVCKMLEEGKSVRYIIEKTNLSESYIRAIKRKRTQIEISSQYNF